jgi:hypothetical protein
MLYDSTSFPTQPYPIEYFGNRSFYFPSPKKQAFAVCPAQLGHLYRANLSELVKVGSYKIDVLYNIAAII